MSVKYRSIQVNGLNVFYREAGSRENPTILLLHGFPSSSHMYRNLIPQLEDRYHLVAPDYPGFGYSDQPSVSEFTYTFDNLAIMMSEFVSKLNVTKYSIYVHDYGAPVGFRLAGMRPERVQAIISQNGNAYEEGIEPSWAPLRAYWKNPSDSVNRENMLHLLSPELTKHQYVHGSRNPETISPDTWKMDQMFLDRPGNADIQLALFYDYQNNLKQFPIWQQYFKTYQPPMLVVWGKNDLFYGPAGALAYQKHLEDVEIHLLNTGHFPLEEELDLSASLIRNFLAKRFIQ